MSPWHEAAEAYDRSLGLLCSGVVPALLEALGTAGRRRLLDAGTGTGRVAKALAGAGFQVDAVDPEQSMIDVANAGRRSTTGGDGTASRARSGPTFRVASLPRLLDPSGAPSPAGHYDAAVATFVINHTSDPRAALRELARVVRPGGQVVISVWPHGASALNALWTEVIERARVSRPVLPRLDPALDFPRSLDGLLSLLDEAGLARAAVTEARWDFTVAPEDLWCAATAGLAVIGAVYRHQDETGRRRLAAEFDRAAGERVVGGVLRLPMTAVVGAAQRI